MPSPNRLCRFGKLSPQRATRCRNRRQKKLPLKQKAVWNLPWLKVVPTNRLPVTKPKWLKNSKQLRYRSPKKLCSAESASADDVPIEHAATDSPVAGSLALKLSRSSRSFPKRVIEVESSTSDQVDREVALRLAVLENALRRQASAASSKPKRRWWSFWRKRQPAEQSVVAKESSAIVSPVAEGVSENSAPEEVAAADQVAVSQSPG